MAARALAKESVLAAFVAIILAIPLIGFTTNDAGGRVVVETRFYWVAIAAAVVFVGRFALGLLPQRTTASGTPQVSEGFGRTLTWLGYTGLAFAILLPFFPFSSNYVLNIATKVLIYVMLGWGLNVVVGLAGLLNLGYVGFYAVGAYTFALLAQWFDLGFWIGLPIAGLVAALVGVLLGLPVLRLRGDYLAIVTLGFGEIIRILLLNGAALTGGPNGINNIPRPTLFGLTFSASAPPGGKTFAQFFGIPFNSQQRFIFLYFVIFALVLATNFVTVRLRRLPLGRAWEALREDEIACRALGINPTSVKLSAFAIGALFAGLAGAFFATWYGFISPENFTFQESATVLAIVVLGGMGNQLGVVLAAAVLVTLPEFGRDFAQYRMLLFGAAMVVIMIWRPRGLLSLRTPSIRLGAVRR